MARKTKTEGKCVHPRIPDSTRSQRTETVPKLIDSHDACAILVDKRSSGALLAIY